MEKLRAILVDDEEPGRKNLTILLNSYCPEVELMGAASSAFEAKEMINCFNPDLVFLDINMPLLNGFEFLEMFDRRDFFVIFVTAHDEFGIQAVKANAVDYLLKPISIRELKLAVQKVIRLKEETLAPGPKKTVVTAGKLAVSHLNGFEIVELDEIIRLEADNNYTTIFTVNQGKIVVSKTIKDFEDNLDSNNFFRIHKTNIINLKHLRKYSKKDGGLVFMSDGAELSISKRRHSLFLEKVNTFLLTIK